MTDLLQRASRYTAIHDATALLGRREREALSVLHELGSATVQQVTEQLNCELAYTTVMTTLDRLFRKGLLQRVKKGRAFLYSPVVSTRDMEGQRANNFVRRFFSESDARPELLISCLVEAVHDYDSGLLDRLESGIRAARTRTREVPDPLTKCDSTREEQK